MDQLPIVGGMFYLGLSQIHPFGHIWPAGTWPWQPLKYRRFEVGPPPPLAKPSLEEEKSAK